MTRDELIETMARAMDAAAGTHSAPPFSATWGEHAAAVLDAIEAAGLAIVPVEATAKQFTYGQEAIRTQSSMASRLVDAESVYRSMIEAGRI